ncbi:MAG: class I SAM-dependent methyltransferase [Acidobacteriota bacterium]|nr:class I SAM-dependent methyltransferase [Blastocatellia bacterium]MDW8239404.1 class I SAM-dependent methyltransferase [Acidobacteriota bacterium]
MLTCERLDGPLVRCQQCGLMYVGQRRHDFTFATTDQGKSRALAARVEALGLVDASVEAAEGPWREKLFADRLRRLQRFIRHGRLLEIGCATGEFLQLAAQAGFQVAGVEPDPQTSALARDRHRLDVTTGTLPEAAYPANRFDVVVMLHVLEHLDSPRQTLHEVHRLLNSGGILLIETPNIQTIWFRLLKTRWRQLIPDHYFFFTPHTLSRLLELTGFRPLQITSVGKPMSVRLFTDRLRRMSPPLGKILTHLIHALRLQDRTLHLNLGDIMLAFAQKTPSTIIEP